MPFWPRSATTSGSLWPGSGLCALFSGRLSWSGMTRAAPLPHPPEHPNSLFHRRLAIIGIAAAAGVVTRDLRSAGRVLIGALAITLLFVAAVIALWPIGELVG